MRVCSSRLSGVAGGVDQRAELLVGAPAAVEDALASLLVEPAAMPRGGGSSAGSTPRSSTAGDGATDALRLRAAATYVRRVYHPFLIREPALVRGEDDGG